jgi:hypothetical protein
MSLTSGCTFTVNKNRKTPTAKQPDFKKSSPVGTQPPQCAPGVCL